MTSYPHGSASSKNYFRHEEGQENVTYNQEQQQQTLPPPKILQTQEDICNGINTQGLQKSYYKYMEDLKEKMEENPSRNENYKKRTKCIFKN